MLSKKFKKVSFKESKKVELSWSKFIVENSKPCVIAIGTFVMSMALILFDDAPSKVRYLYYGLLSISPKTQNEWIFVGVIALTCFIVALLLYSFLGRFPFLAFFLAIVLLAMLLLKIINIHEADTEIKNE